MTTVARPGSSPLVGTSEPTTSERYRWLEKVREHQARQERIRKLREDLAAARAAGKAIRHARRLERARRENA